MRGKPGLTDSHAHLDRYPEEELRGVLDRARQTGVAWIVTVGMDLASSGRAVKLAREHAGVLASVGIHPWVVAEGLPERFADTIHELATEKVTVAIGEVGLDSVENVFLGIDYRLNASLLHAQEVAFRRQVEVAAELDCPLNIHCRGTYPKLISILIEERAHRSRGVVHNFDGDFVSLTSLLDLGFYVSFGGALTYPQATVLRRTAKKAPLDAVLIETDAPYMPLHGDSARVNEPANVVQIARRLAELKGIEDAEVIEVTYRNFATLFGIKSVHDVG